MKKQIWVGIVAAAFALGVYSAARALDAETNAIAKTVQGTLTEDGVDRSQDATSLSLLEFSNRAAAVLVWVFFVGGLPAALLAIVTDRIHRRRSQPPRLSQSVYQASLVFQMVSIFLSVLWVVPSVASWQDLGTRGWYFLAYFGGQLLLGIWAVPAWRRCHQQASAVHIRRSFLRGAA